MNALERANATRGARAIVRHAVKAGEMTMTDALRHPAVQGARIVDVLGWQHRWGSYRASRLLSDLFVGEHRLVMALTDRQRRMILERAS